MIDQAYKRKMDLPLAWQQNENDLFPSKIAAAGYPGETETATHVTVRSVPGTKRIEELLLHQNRVLEEEIAERIRTEDELRQREREFRALVEHTPDTVVRYDRDCRRLYVNPTFERLSGKPAAELVNATPAVSPVTSSPAVSEQVQRAVAHVAENGTPLEIELEWTDRKGVFHCYLNRFVPEFGPSGEVVSVLSVARDITEVKLNQERLQDLAYSDPLTRLPNRTRLRERLQDEIVEAARVGCGIGLICLDMDRFKNVNDALGHGVGDLLLLEAAKRLKGVVGECDTVARLGGDEFALIVPSLHGERDLASVAGKCLEAFSFPFRLEERDLYVTASIGIAVSPGDSSEPDELLRCAEVAMYHAKAGGRNAFRFHSASMSERANERMTLEGHLRGAIRSNQLVLYFQQKIDLACNAVTGAEALIRWQHPELGMIPPDRFIGIAEDTGMILEIGAWVLRTACLAVKEWNGGAGQPLSVAVNISPRQIMSGNLPATVRAILAETGCRPEWLEFEITESVLLEDLESVQAVLEELHDMGISIAIDDFGTGYSALGYLIRLPISTLKIDRSFVREMVQNRPSLALVRMIITLAWSLGARIVAEGVETHEQEECLSSLGCRLVQGYLYGKPMPKAEFEALCGKTGTEVKS